MTNRRPWFRAVRWEDAIVKRVALSTNFPKRIYGGEGNEEADDEKTLKECDLCPQAVLMVQDLDA